MAEAIEDVNTVAGGVSTTIATLIHDRDMRTIDETQLYCRLAIEGGMRGGA